MKNLGTHLLSALAGALLGFFAQTFTTTPAVLPSPAKKADSAMVKTFKADTIVVKKADTAAIKLKH